MPVTTLPKSLVSGCINPYTSILEQIDSLRAEVETLAESIYSVDTALSLYSGNPVANSVVTYNIRQIESKLITITSYQ